MGRRMPLKLSGTEELSIEVPGFLPKDAAMALLGDDLTPQTVRGQVPVSLLVFQMKGLKADGVPGAGMNYGEALWRIGIVLDGEPAWFGLTCDIDKALVRKSAGWLVRYPVRPATLSFEGSRARGAVEITAAGKRCAIVATPTLAEPPEAEPPRRLVVRNRNALWEVPWGEVPAPFRRAARIALAAEDLADATFGDRLRLLPEGLLHRGRTHRCGIARKLG